MDREDLNRGPFTTLNVVRTILEWRCSHPDAIRIEAAAPDQDIVAPSTASAIALQGDPEAREIAVAESGASAVELRTSADFYAPAGAGGE